MTYLRYCHGRVLSEGVGRALSQDVKSRTRGRPGFALACAFLTNGCISMTPQEIKGAPYPNPSEQARHERKEAKTPTVDVAATRDAIDVTLVTPVECRDQTPMVQDVEVKRSTSTLAQSMNAVGALGLGALGAGFIAADCSVTPDPTNTNPNPSSRPCTSKEQGQTYAVGGVSIAGAAVFGAVFVYNIIKAKDSKHTERLETLPSEWKSCDSVPLANTPVRLAFAGTQRVDGTTDSSGKVRFDTSRIEWSDEVYHPGYALLFVVNRAASEVRVPFDGLPQYLAWKQRALQEAQRCARKCEDAVVDCMVVQARLTGCVPGQMACPHIVQTCHGAVASCEQECIGGR